MTQPVPVHVAAFDLCEKIAKAIPPLVPSGFRGKLTITVSNGRVRPEDVLVEFRPVQAGTVGIR